MKGVFTLISLNGYQRISTQVLISTTTNDIVLLSGVGWPQHLGASKG